MTKRYIGIDVGAETLKVVELRDEDGKCSIASKQRISHHKDPKAALRGVLSAMSYETIDAIGVCGRLGRMFKVMQIPDKLARAE